MKKVISVLMALVLVASILAACGGGNSGPSGKYNLVSFTEDGETIEASQLTEMGLDTDGFYIEFVDGSKVKLATFGEVTDGTYKLDSKNIAFTVDGDPASATIDGNKITLNADGVIMVYEKK